MEKYTLPQSNERNLFNRTFLKPLFLKCQCPKCLRLYRIDTRDLEFGTNFAGGGAAKNSGAAKIDRGGASKIGGIGAAKNKRDPEFECINCNNIFAIETPIQDPKKIVTRLLFRPQELLNDNIDQASESVAAGEASENSKRSNSDSCTFVKSKLKKIGINSKIEEFGTEVKSCPKCSALNPKAFKECIKCGVIFSRLENLPLDPKLGAIPSLVRAWQDLMSDYTNLKKHFAFLDQCEELKALPYALKKYEDLKSVQQQDQIAREMLHRTLFRQFARKANNLSSRYPMVRFLSNLPWARIFKIAPVCFALFFILIGIFSQSLRNLVGIGVAIGFIYLGMMTFVQGRIHWRDYL